MCSKLTVGTPGLKLGEDLPLQDNKKKDLSKERSKSGGPGSNRQPLAWKAKALPLSYRREHDNYTKIWRFLKGFLKKLLEKYEKNSKFTLA